MEAQMFDTPQGDIEQKNKSIQFLRKLQLGDLCFRDLMQYGLVMLGKTKAGKTTLAHHLIKNPLKGSEDQNYVLEGGIRFKEAIIGHSNVSQTQIPNQIIAKLSQSRVASEHKILSPEKSSKQQIKYLIKQDKMQKKQSQNEKIDLHIIDCPGYSDSKGCYMQIANGYFHYRVFSKVKNIKFVLVMDYTMFTGIAQKPADTIIQFLMSFKNLNEIKEKIINATSFVFTKLRKLNKQSDDQIKEYIKNKLILLKQSSIIQNVIEYRDVIEQLIDTIIDKKRYYFFEKAQANVPAPVSDLLSEISSNTTYWSRQSSPQINQVDMSHIQMTLGRKCFEEASKNKQFSEDYKSLMNEFNERFSTAIAYTYKKTNLAKITQIFLLNSLYGKGTNKNYETQINKFHPDLYFQQVQDKDFYTQIKQFNKFFNIYGKDEVAGKAKEYAMKRSQLKAALTKCPHPIIDKTQTAQIQRLQIVKMIMDVVSIKQQLLVNDRSLVRLRSISNKILTILAQLKKIKLYLNKEEQARYVQTIQQFYYIIFRLLQQARVFKILFTFTIAPNEKQQLDQVLLKNVDSIQILFDYSQALTNQKYYGVGLGKEGSMEKIKSYYFLNTYEVKPNQSTAYYVEIDTYFDDMIITKKQMLQETQKKRILLRKNNIEKNGGEFKKADKLLELVKNMRSAAKIAVMQGLNSSQNVENIELIINQLNELNELGYELSTIQAKKSQKIEDVRTYLKAAIEAFKSTKNVYKCVDSYKQLISRYDDKKDANELLIILEEKAQYCSKNGRIQLAIQVYQHAFSIVQFLKLANGSNSMKLQIQKRKEICKKIGMIGISKKYSPSDDYYEQMMRYTIYDEIDFTVFDRIQKLLTLAQ